MQYSKPVQSIEKLILIGLLLIAAIIYWPGLGGPFLFDDYANLAALGEYGGIHDWESLKLFVLGNHSGPTGRPLSMLSFVLNRNHWPADPWSFKLTNLLLHMVNAILLYKVTGIVIGHVLGSDDRYSLIWIKALATGIWLFHPFNVSTVLYAVQRMTILSTLFMLAGLYLYLSYRTKLSEQPKRGYLMMSIAVIFCTALATLSKENGALLPILILCIEITVFSKTAPDIDIRWKAVFLWSPAILLFTSLYFYISSGMMADAYAYRPFTALERLLTQPRIIFDYLYYWFIPHINHTGLLSQNFIISRSLLDPLSTLFALLGIVFLFISAVTLRKRMPVYALAVLFYLCGHIMESSILPLELYYEHRNYLPTIFLWLPLIVLFSKHIKTMRKAAHGLLVIICLGGLAFLTSARASIWADEESLAYHWADTNPTSQRAQRHAAIVAVKNNKIALAIDILENAEKNMPENIAIHMHRLTVNCQIRKISREEKQHTETLLSTGYFSFKSFAFLEDTFRMISKERCMNLSFDDAYRFLQALHTNPNSKGKAGPKHQLYFLEGILALEQGLADDASQLFRKSIEIYGNIDAALIQVGLLASAEEYELAISHIDFIEQRFDIASHVRPGKLDYTDEIGVLRKKIHRNIIQPTKTR